MNQVEIIRRQVQLCAIGLWLVAIWILGKSIGDNGVAYLAAALEAFIFLWTFLGANLQDTLEKLLRGRNTKGQYKNADKLRKSALIYGGASGIAGSLLVFVLATYLSEGLLKVPYCRFMIMLLAPTVFLRCISAVILGSFQGEGSELPHVVVAVIKPLLFLGFSLLFSGRLSEYGEKVSNLLGQEDFRAMYGAIGVVIAMVLAEVLVFVFLLLIYRGAGKNRKKREHEGMRTTDSFLGQIYVLCGSMWLSVVQGILLFLPMLLSLILFQKSVPDIYASAQSYGVYAGKYLGVCGVIIVLMATLIFPSAVKAGNLLRKDEYRNARFHFQSGLKAGVVFSLYFAVLFTVMAAQTAGTVSKSMISSLAEMFTVGSGIILLGTMAYYSYTVLKLAGKKYWLLGGILVADIVSGVTLAIWLGKTPGNIMVLVYCGLIYSGVLAVILCILCCVFLRSGLDWIRMFAVPIACVCVVGLLCRMLGKMLTPHLGNGVTLLAVLVVSGLLYLIAVVFLHCFREQEIATVPGGRIIRAIGQMLGLF